LERLESGNGLISLVAEEGLGKSRRGKRKRKRSSITGAKKLQRKFTNGRRNSLRGGKSRQVEKRLRRGENYRGGQGKERGGVKS